MKKSAKKPFFLKRLASHLPKKFGHLPKNLKISAFVTGTIQIGLTALGTAMGVGAAATVPGMIGLGALGFVVGNVAGGLLGLTAFAAIITHNLRKEQKAAKNKKSSAVSQTPAPEAPKQAGPVADKQLKSDFKAANENVAAVEKPAQAAPEQKKAAGPSVG
jgi:hypothetical protein